MINTKEVADYVASTNNLSKAAVLEILKNAFAFIKAEVSDGNTVNIDKFGKFTSVQKPGRTGRNPKTGEPMQIEAKTAVKFVVAADFKNSVNGK